MVGVFYPPPKRNTPLTIINIIHSFSIIIHGTSSWLWDWGCSMNVNDNWATGSACEHNTWGIAFGRGGEYAHQIPARCMRRIKGCPDGSASTACDYGGLLCNLYPSTSEQWTKEVTRQPLILFLETIYSLLSIGFCNGDSIWNYFTQPNKVVGS